MMVNKHAQNTATPKREYESLILRDITLIHYFHKYGKKSQARKAMKRLQQWFRLQAEQEGKR